MAELDLNLLSVFDALYELRSVTRTAERLNLTQSAISHALRRLRRLVDDPLFLRGGGVLQPTARAREMAPNVSEGLARLRRSMLPDSFDPETAQRTFTVAAGHYLCTLLMPRLIVRLRRTAPGIALQVYPVAVELLNQLDEGGIDLAVGVFSRVPARLDAAALFGEELVWIAARDNPVARAATGLDDLRDQPIVRLASSRPFEQTKALVDDGALEAVRLGEFGRAAGAETHPTIVYDSLTAAAIVAATDMVALVPRRLARRAAEGLDLVILDLDEARPSFEVSMLSHSRSRGDEGLEWLKGQLLLESGG